MPKIALLGDSILANNLYVDKAKGKKSVVEHLNNVLPPGWQAELLAVDGAKLQDLPEQISRIPDDTTHLVISIGGNDVLEISEVLGLPVKSVGAALWQMSLHQLKFDIGYESAISSLVDTGLPLLVLTIWNPCEPKDLQTLQQVEETGLSIFNDVVLRTATRHKVPVIDLRDVCMTRACYSNPIEPSHHGGRKIARVIANHHVGFADVNQGQEEYDEQEPKFSLSL